MVALNPDARERNCRLSNSVLTSDLKFRRRGCVAVRAFTPNEIRGLFLKTSKCVRIRVEIVAFCGAAIIFST